MGFKTWGGDCSLDGRHLAFRIKFRLRECRGAAICFRLKPQAWSFHNPSAEVEAGEKMEAVFRARDQMSSLVGARVGFMVWGDVPQSEAEQRLRRVGGGNAVGWHQACEGIDSRSQGRRSCLETRLRKRRNQGKRGKGFLSSALQTPARLRNRIWGPIKSSSLISAVRT